MSEARKLFETAHDISNDIMRAVEDLPDTKIGKFDVSFDWLIGACKKLVNAMDELDYEADWNGDG